MPGPPTPSEPWEPFVGGLRRFVAGRVAPAHADDVLQDVLVRLHRAPALRDPARVASWVYGVARRAVADHHRQRGRAAAPAALDDEPADPDAQAPENLARYAGTHSVHEEVLSWLRPLAESLPEPHRRALLLADFDGHPQQHVADALGLSLSGAKSRVQRARVALGQALRACCAVEFGPDGRASAFRRVMCDC